MTKLMIRINDVLCTLADKTPSRTKQDASYIPGLDTLVAWFFWHGYTD